MKKLLLLSAFVAFAIASYAQTAPAPAPVPAANPAPRMQSNANQMTPFGVTGDDFRKAMTFRSKLMQQDADIKALLKQSMELQEKIDDLVLSKADPEVKAILVKIKAKREEMRARAVKPAPVPVAPAPVPAPVPVAPAN